MELSDSSFRGTPQENDPFLDGIFPYFPIIHQPSSYWVADELETSNHGSSMRISPASGGLLGISAGSPRGDQLVGWCMMLWSIFLVHKKYRCCFCRLRLCSDLSYKKKNWRIWVSSRAWGWFGGFLKWGYPPNIHFNKIFHEILNNLLLCTPMTMETPI